MTVGATIKAKIQYHVLHKRWCAINVMRRNLLKTNMSVLVLSLLNHKELTNILNYHKISGLNF